MRLPRPKASPLESFSLGESPSAQGFSPRLLDLLCRSDLGSIPQTLITPEQISRVLKGLPVEPTPRQLDLTRRGKFLDRGEDLSRTA